MKRNKEKNTCTEDKYMVNYIFNKNSKKDLNEILKKSFLVSLQTESNLKF